ncbi:MAG: GMC family oxidoreductase [Capsulimonadales bacterium]|nr:GMC family oxidoreductase [Capsulimonadales bacterium]
MIRDIRDFEAGISLDAEVCIVGSGALGLAVAREFLSESARVIVLEGGGPAHEDESQDPYRSEVIGIPHEGIHIGRTRVLGGTTTLWAGQALPLAEIDFEKRDWVAESGWPITKEDLTDYYRRAEDVMEVEHLGYDRESWPHADDAPPAYDPDIAYPLFSQFTLTPDFRDKYREPLAASANVEVITHANVLSLEANEGATAVREVRARSLDGRDLTVRARYVVVACGGIESARLLLVSDSVEKTGIGNRHDVVGRYFQDHPHYVVESVHPRNPHQFDRWFNAFVRGRVRFALKAAASERLQREKRITGIVCEIHYPSDPNDPLAAARQIMAVLRGQAQSAGLLPSLGRVARQPGRIVSEVFRRTVLNQAVSQGAVRPQLVFGCEQEPNPNSRVRLSDVRDRLGVRRTVLDWQVTGAEYRAIEVFAQALSGEWQRLGIADLDLSKMDFSGSEGTLKDSYHHIGTTRMGTDPRTSVVDARCRVHGYDNLYVAGSSVFPTGGFSNPTLTAIALALRSADEIKRALSRSDPSRV